MPARGKRGDSSDSASDSSSDDRNKRQSKSKPVPDSSDSGSSSGDSSGDSTPPKRRPQRQQIGSTSRQNRNAKASPPRRRRPPSPKNSKHPPPDTSRQPKNNAPLPFSKRPPSPRSRSPKAGVRGPRTPSHSPPKVKKEPSLVREQTTRHKRSRSPKDKQRRTRSPKTRASPQKSKSAPSAKSPHRPRDGARPKSPIPPTNKPASRVHKDTTTTNSSDNETPQKRTRNDVEPGLVSNAPRNWGPRPPQGSGSPHADERDLRGGVGEHPIRPHSMSRFESESDNEAPSARQKNIRGLKSSVQRPESPGRGKRRRVRSGDDARESRSEGEFSDREQSHPQPARRSLDRSPKHGWDRYSNRSPHPEERPGVSGRNWSHDYGGHQRYSPQPDNVGHAFDHTMNRHTESHPYPSDSREYRRNMESEERAWRAYNRSSPRRHPDIPGQRYPEPGYSYEDELRERQRHEEEWDRYYRENGHYEHWQREENAPWFMPHANFPDRRGDQYPDSREQWQNYSQRPRQSAWPDMDRNKKRQERKLLLERRRMEHHRNMHDYDTSFDKRMQNSDKHDPSSHEPGAGENNQLSQTSADRNNTSRDKERDDQRNDSKGKEIPESGDHIRRHDRNKSPQSRTGQGDTEREPIPRDQSVSHPSNRNQSRKQDERSDQQSWDANPRHDRVSRDRDPRQKDENKEQEDLPKVSRDSRKRSSMESDRNTSNSRNKENVSTVKDGSSASKKPRDRENHSSSPAPKKAKTVALTTDSPNQSGADVLSGRSSDAARKDKALTPTERSHVAPSTKSDTGRSSGAPKGSTLAAATGADVLTGRTGGAYIPPAKLRMMQAQITDKSSVAYQRIAWEALKKSINGLVNKVNISNMPDIARELFHENIVRGRGMLSRSILQAQAASLTFTHVYAAMVAIINTKFPQIGELILKRLIIQFRRGFKRNNKELCLSSTTFVAHLINQQVAHEVLALEILTLLLEEPSEDSVEIAVGFLKASGQKLTEVSPRGSNAIFERLRNILHEGQMEKRVQYMIEVVMAIRKDGFKDFLAVVDKLDLVEEAEQFTHLMTLDVDGNEENGLNVFKADPDYLENEEKYATLKKDILEESSSDGEGESGSDESDDEDDEDEEAKQTIIDSTETNLVMLRRTIYLTIQSSLDFEECAHKLLKMELKPGQEVELCSMILDCCAQQRTYEKFYGLLAQRFCQIDKKYVEPYQNIFKEQFDTIHRLETNKLRNVAKFFGHLLHSDGISWGVLSCIKLNEEDTTSASRIFVKILFQELSEFMGLPKLNERLTDKTLQVYFEGILPRDNPNNTRFAINFFTTIGLGGLTDDLREHLKGVTKEIQQQKIKEQLQQQEQKPAPAAPASSTSAGSSSSSDSSSSGSGGSSGSESDTESSDSEVEKKKKKKQKLRKTKPHSPEKPRKKGRDKVKTSEKTDRNKKNSAVEKAKKKRDSNQNISDKSKRKDDRQKDLPENVRKNEVLGDRTRDGDQEHDRIHDGQREHDRNTVDNRDHNNINYPDRPVPGERGYQNDDGFTNYGDDRGRRFDDERNMEFNNGRDRMRQGYSYDREAEFRRNRGGRQDGFRNFNNQRGGRSQPPRMGQRQNRQRVMSGQKIQNRRNHGGQRNTPRNMR